MFDFGVWLGCLAKMILFEVVVVVLVVELGCGLLLVLIWVGGLFGFVVCCIGWYVLSIWLCWLGWLVLVVSCIG